MKKIIIVFGILLLFTQAQAQLKGAGKVLSRSFDLKDFDKIFILDFDGTIDVQVGKPYSIVIEIDENLNQRLQLKRDKSDSSIVISLEGNKNGKLYLANTRIKIKVSLPTITAFMQRGNANSQIRGLDGIYFKLKNVGNGSLSLIGNIEELDINKIGNGNIDATKLITKTANVRTLGNGDVTVNTQLSLSAIGSGNGNVIQTGRGKISSLSEIKGNGEVRMR